MFLEFEYRKYSIYLSFTFEIDIEKGVLTIDIYNFIRN